MNTFTCTSKPLFTLFLPLQNILSPPAIHNLTVPKNTASIMNNAYKSHTNTSKHAYPPTPKKDLEGFRQFFYKQSIFQTSKTRFRCAENNTNMRFAPVAF